MEVLSGKFEREEDYFGEILQLLTNYLWIYKTRNTDILVDNILNCVPDNWIPILQLKYLDNIELAIKGESKSSWPLDLVEFVTQCRRLSLRTDFSRKENCATLKWKKVNPKKVHEVVNFSQLIGENCEKNKISHVVDIGAGLGYLDKELAERWNVHVLGLERDTYRVSTANQRSETSATDRCRATFRELNVDAKDTWKDQVESVIDNWLQELDASQNSPPICMIGLHSCGDLSPVMMKLFINSRHFRTLLLVSCCYHRMEWSKNSQEHFPLSQSLRSVCCKLDNSALPFHEQDGIPYLFRLAAQETPNQWLEQDTQSHQSQAEHTFYRAVLQLYAAREGIELLKQQRRPVKKGNLSAAFEDYVDQAIKGFGLEGDHHQGQLMDIYRLNEHLSSSLETLLILQILLQPVAEALILCDRVAFLKESGVARVSLQKLFDDRISPRCFVTVAEKLSP